MVLLGSSLADIFANYGVLDHVHVNKSFKAEIVTFGCHFKAHVGGDFFPVTFGHPLFPESKGDGNNRLEFVNLLLHVLCDVEDVLKTLAVSEEAEDLVNDLHVALEFVLKLVRI